MHPLVAAIIAGSGGGIPVQLTVATYYRIGGGVTFSLDSDGDVTVVTLSGTPGALDWFKGNPSTGIGSSWEVYADVQSGSVSTGTTGSWVALTSGQTWTREPPGTTGTEEVIIQFQFRPAGGSSAVYTSGNITIQAESF